MKEIIKSKVINVIGVTSLFIVSTWVMYFINNKLLGGALSYGVQPRVVEVGQIFGISFSWLFHENYKHLLGNTLGLLMLLPVIALMEKKPYKIIFICTVLGGFLTWCLGASNTNHIGASGMIFALMGFILSAATIGRAWRYLIPLALSFSNFWFMIYNGLIPQSNISFAGHFGGLVAGLFLGWLISREQNREKEFEQQYMVKADKKWYEIWKKKPEDQWKMENILKGDKKYKYK